MADLGGGSARHEDGVGVLQDARYQRPGYHPGGRYQQEARTPADDGGDLSYHALQFVGSEADRRLQQSDEDHLQSRPRVLHRRYSRCVRSRTRINVPSFPKRQIRTVYCFLLREIFSRNFEKS